MTSEPAIPGQSPAPAAAATPVAIVGLACRYPDADDPGALLDSVLTGRRAFRRIPRCRLDLADYYSPDPAAADTTYSTRAALLEGWRFDAAAFGISGDALASADPAHLLALETTARALAAAGFPGGAGLPAQRSVAYLGGTWPAGGDPAAAVRLRWPYARRVLSEALSGCGVPADTAKRVLAAAAERYLAPLPPVTGGELAGTTPAAIAAGLSGRLGLRAGGIAVDAGGASSLAAVVSACRALTAGEIDAAVAAGVDLGIDPLGLIGPAREGVLAVGEMRLYDENPTGFLPGEGCGVVLLMRTADARAAGLPVYAEILGWGIASGGPPALAWPASEAGAAGRADQAGAAGEPDQAAQASRPPDAASGPGGHLLAMRLAHEIAGVDPADVQLIEGCGAGVAAADQAELAALAELRAGSRHVAALGSVSAGIGNTRAAAGTAGLIKAVLAITNGVLPPSVGVRVPHPLLRDGRAALRLPAAPEPWPAGTRHAAVGAAGPGGLAVHLVLRGDPSAPAPGGRTSQPRPRSLPRAVQAPNPAPARSLRPARFRARQALPPQNLTEPALRLAAARPPGAHSRDPRQPFAYLLDAADQAAMTAVLTRIAQIAPWLSDAQLQDLAVQRSAAAAGAAPVRVALTAAGQDELAGLAGEAARLLPGLTSPVLGTRPGIFAHPGTGGAQERGGQVALVISGHPDDLLDLPQRQLSRILAVLRWLDELGVEASAAAGHGIGELAGLVWAGCTTPADARSLTALRSAALAAPPDTAPGHLGTAIGKFGTFAFRPPARRLVSGSTGREVTTPDEIGEMLCAELLGARTGAGRAPRTAPGAPSRDEDRDKAHDGGPLAAALEAVAADAGLLVLTGLDQQLADAVGRLGRRGPGGLARPAVSINGDPAADASVAQAAAALFAAGAMARPGALYAGRPGRPIDIWREQVFITHPCQAQLPDPAADQATADQATADQATADQATADQATADQATADQATADQAANAAASPGTPVGSPATAPRYTPASAAPAQPDPAQPDPARPAPAEPAPAEPTPAEPTAGQPDAAGAAQGIAPWFRCYAERLQPPALPVPRGDDRAWRIYAGGREPLRLRAEKVFPADPAAGRTLAVIGGLDDAAAREAATLALRDAISTGELVAIGAAPGLAGLCATLHAEHPSAGVTVLRPAGKDKPAEGEPAGGGLTEAWLAAARRFAAVTPGGYRELCVRPDGTAAEPVQAVLGGLAGDFPIGPDDVALISRSSGAAGLTLAQVLACSGAAVVIIGRDHPHRDDQVIAGLEQLRAAGASVGYELVDLADHAALAAAVRRVEARFGRVTAISHAAGQVPPLPVAQLTPEWVQEQAGRHAGPLDQLAAAARTAARASAAGPGQLRLILTGGSVASRYGLAGEAPGALVSGALADLAQRLASASPGCAAVHLDWPAFSGEGLGERADLAERLTRAGFTAMPVAEGSRQLLKLLSAGDLPRRVTVLGRVGVPAPRRVAAAAVAAAGREAERTSSRFVERVLVHYPGVELIAEAGLSLLADPYLGDYRIDGVPVLPAAMALEAMAQAASALAGQPARRAAGISMRAPIALPAGAPGSKTVIRLCALRDGDFVTVLIRSDLSGFAVEHCRAVFSLDAAGLPRSPLSGSLPEADPAERAAEAGYGSELYGRVLFQGGRFMRLATVRLAGSRAAIGLADGSDDQPWFGAVPPARSAAGQRLVLGSAGLADAALQLLQACVPHRRLLLDRCDHAAFSGREPEGMVTIRAVRQGPPVPAPREGQGAGWDVDAADAAGDVLFAWSGVRMRDAGPLQPREPAATAMQRPAVTTAMGSPRAE